jgi:hypothetical protein
MFPKPQHRDDMVLRYEKSEHALLDDDNARSASGPADLSAGRIGQSIPMGDQCQPRTVRNYVCEADAEREMIVNNFHPSAPRRGEVSLLTPGHETWFVGNERIIVIDIACSGGLLDSRRRATLPQAALAHT